MRITAASLRRPLFWVDAILMAVILLLTALLGPQLANTYFGPHCPHHMQVAHAITDVIPVASVIICVLLLTLRIVLQFRFRPSRPAGLALTFRVLLASMIIAYITLLVWPVFHMCGEM
jgi:hypothetical protein